MKTLAEQIAALEAKRQASAAQMETVMQKTLDEDRTSDAAEQETFDTLASEVEAIDKDLTRLRKLEAAKAVTAKSVVKAETVHEGSMARGGLARLCGAEAKHRAAGLVWRALTCKMKAHFTKQSPIEITQAGIRRRRADPRGAEFHHHQGGGGAGRYRDLGLGLAARRNLDSGLFLRAAAEFGLPGIGGAWWEVLVRQCWYCQHADAGKHADDRRDRSSPRAHRSRCGRVRSRRSPSRRRRWR